MNAFFESVKRAAPIGDAIERLGGSVRNKKTRCPNSSAHKNGDKDPSCSIDAEKGLFYCHTCGASGSVIDYARILHRHSDALSAAKELAALYGVSAPVKRQTESREHLYHDAGGKPVALKRIRKFDDGSKSVLWFLTDAQGRPAAKPGLQGLDVPLYHAHRLHGNTAVFLPEGEKDCETLEHMGFPAVAVPGGAGAHWKPGYSEMLRGRVVYVLTDNDQPGEKFGITAANGLRGAAAGVKIIPAAAIYDKVPPKGDISDIVQQIGQDAAKAALLAAADSAPDYVPVPKTVSVPEETGRQQLTIALLEQELTARGWSVWLDEISARTCCTGGDLDTLLNHLESDLRPVYKYVNIDTLNRWAAEIAKQNRRNPVLEAIRQEAWDGVERIPLLFQAMHITSDRLSCALVRKWLYQAVILLTNDEQQPTGADGVLTLQARQGYGKTRLGRWLSMRPAWFTEGGRLSSTDKDDLRRLVTRWISELGELDATFRRCDVASLKSFITAPVDRFRLPYGRNDVDKARRTSLLATVNDTAFLVDTTGNRRFWTVSLALPVDFDLLAFDPVLLWREAMHMAEQLGRDCFRLTDAEAAALAERNGSHEVPAAGLQEVRDILAKAAQYPNSYEEKLLTVSDVRNMYYRELGHVPVVWIGRALNVCGIQQTKTGKGRFYKVPVPKYSAK